MNIIEAIECLQDGYRIKRGTGNYWIHLKSNGDLVDESGELACIEIWGTDDLKDDTWVAEENVEPCLYIDETDNSYYIRYHGVWYYWLQSASKWQVLKNAVHMAYL